MIMAPHCFKRKCRHYRGILQPDGTEATEVPYCDAFPEGIPNEIAYGDNLHTRPLADQENDIVFEKE
ncbi:MAG: hypothetical protein WC992_06805 [Acholeplasmataceae bacterium]